MKWFLDHKLINLQMWIQIFSMLIKIRQSMNKLSPKGTDNLHLVFKEGIYFSDGWSLLFWEFDHVKNKKYHF